ncbi:uncharacterized protein G2W53_007785 [Senna tora]|uniref:Uncharacterized protein n=1 Tax=Senna tora TaxID=362788 RepID=A0A834X601_9FABA|nr:uncharacterized protein G2W53_007785 [Senna tora]
MHPSSPIASYVSSLFLLLLLPPPFLHLLLHSRLAERGSRRSHVVVVGVSIEGVALPEAESEAEDLLSSLLAKSLPFLGNGFSDGTRSIAADSNNWD